MGNLLGSPITEKETHVGSSDCGLEFGVSSMQGWRIHMEDAHIAEPNLYAEQVSRTAADEPKKLALPGHALFAVFDGHGGTFAAEYAGKNLCRVLSREPKFIRYAKFAQERAQKEATLEGSSERATYVRNGLELLEGALRDCFVDLDREILLAVQGSQVSEANTPYHEENHSENASRQSAASTAPSEAPSDENGEFSTPTKEQQQQHPVPSDDEDAGTTAVVVMVTPQWIVCANAGDSRAVWSKQGNKAVPLSYDHKPDDEDEMRRIKAAGGYVSGGRVDGDLAVSRGLGDYRFKEPRAVLMGSEHVNNPGNPNGSDDDDDDESMIDPDDQKVSPLPDIVVQTRNPEIDEFIIVACDGIWDVQSNYEGVKMVADIFGDGESNMGLAAEEVLDLCLRMGSKDNMTALLAKFPAQKIGEGGGGVLARRQLREEAENAEEKEGGDEPSPYT